MRRRGLWQESRCVDDRARRKRQKAGLSYGGDRGKSRPAVSFRHAASRFTLSSEAGVPHLLLERYVSRVGRGEFEHDPAQEQALRGLEKLALELAFYRPARKSAALGWLGGGREKAAPLRGAYIWGAVGRGKTMLMDLFFDETQLTHKKRLHFHSFMADVHARIFAFRQQLKKGRGEGRRSDHAGRRGDRGRLLASLSR